MHKHYIAIDTETGGFDPKTSALLSIAAVPSWDVAPFIAHILPIGDVTPAAALRCGYSPEEWAARGAVSLKHALIGLQLWLQSVGAKEKAPALVAHNAAFDQPMVREAEIRSGIRLELPRTWRCSMQALRFAQDAGLARGTDATLTTLGDLCGFWSAEDPRTDAYHAMDDARACLAGYLWLLSLAKKEKGLA